MLTTASFLITCKALYFYRKVSTVQIYCLLKYLKINDNSNGKNLIMIYAKK